MQRSISLPVLVHTKGYWDATPVATDPLKSLMSSWSWLVGGNAKMKLLKQPVR
jgi:hypothetical protein